VRAREGFYAEAALRDVGQQPLFPTAVAPQGGAILGDFLLFEEGREIFALRLEVV
jgi:hypothetical protein